MFWPTLTHYGWAVSIRTAGQFVALQVDSFHHNGWRYWVRIRTRQALNRYFDFYNRRRPHSALDDKTPDMAYFNQPPLAAAA